jgi:ribose-phosphate pyrophosphokinase
MPLTLVPLPGNEDAAARIASALPADVAVPGFRRFPDGETYLRLDRDLGGRETVIVCTLDRPDPKAIQIVFLARLLRELGAARVGLIAPYLAYMRQDRRFHAGEALTSRYFGALLSFHVDWFITVDPHLHRRGSLAEIYSIPARVASSAPLISTYIREHVAQPMLIGPDSESEQWVAAVAAGAGAPHVILEKERRGDRDVRVSVPNGARLRGRTPVLVDDIISTGRTMIETVRHLRESGMPAPVCLGIHAVFAEGALAELRAAGAERIVTTNTIAHETNGIDVTPIIAAAVKESMRTT